MSETSISIQYQSSADCSSEDIHEFLMPFMESGFLLSREPGEITRLKQHGFVATQDKQIVGFAAVEFYSGKLAELQCLAVAPEHRRLGIGKALVRHCCEEASKVGVKELMAISASDEMFKACGFDYSLPNQKRALFFQAGDSDRTD